MNKRDAKREVARLVERLQNMKPREFKRYDEENTKKDFILPLFRALGWEVESRREVTAEDRVSRRRVDYAFRVDGRIAFFLEAKPLKADLDNPQYARQAIDYAWTKGVTWAVLTDFEGLKVFNAEWKERDLRKNVLKQISYTEYQDRFEELWLLSKPAMEAGLLDQEAEKWGRKTRKKPVGDQLFDDLVRWRWELRRHLIPYNKDYTAAQIDEAVQRILDRLIFIRTTEDREIEQERLLLSLVRQWQEGGRRGDLVQVLNEVFRDFDEGYDSALFERHFSEELVGESKPFEDTILGLYRTPDKITEYDFNAIGADVLGGIYEQYLGYAQGLAEEEAAAKRARRKKQGIYYTPQFVVDYIVQNTVGRLLEERTHHEIRNLRILDPACGSGSFLIAAFDALDNYHRGLTGDVASAFSPTKQAGYSGEIFDLSRRIQILTENLYGVDLDPQAVEIAQLNLLLKTLTRRERLPNLNPNIRRGNSLISGTPEELSEHFGDAWEEKHPFNWEEEFPKIMGEGGFDVVIGNPPYVRIQTMDRQEVSYFKDRYQAATGNYDIYTLFIERGWDLLKPGGMLGLIVPNKFMQASYGKGLRALLSGRRAVTGVVDFQDAEVFVTGTNYTCLLFLKKEKGQELHYIPAGEYLESVTAGPNLRALEAASISIDARSLGEAPWVFVSAGAAALMARLKEQGPTLAQVAERIFQGLITGADSVFLLKGRGSPRRGLRPVYSKALDRVVDLETDLLKPLLKGSLSIQRYHADNQGRYLLFPYDRIEGETRLIPDSTFEDQYPRSREYLLENRPALQERDRGKMRGDTWYGFSRPQNLSLFEVPKLLTPSIGRQAAFTFDREGVFYLVGSGGGGGGGYGILLAPQGPSPLYVLGLLNSRLLDWYLKQISSRFRGGYFAFNKQYIERLPIRSIEPDDPEGVKIHDRLGALVNRVVDLHEHLADAPEGSSRRADLERRIARTDQQIDDLVYGLYGITDKQRQIIEGEFEGRRDD